MSALMKLPEGVRYCLNTLTLAGKEVYLVGGCVRDALLGIPPHDFDLCTIATPDQVRALFDEHDLVLAGLKHGTVGVVVDGEVVEITTYRRETGYSDNRHPDRVEFTKSIHQDLWRRDFTVNAMAWNPYRPLLDPFDGQKDLENKILRAVGDPVKRFQEDSLRILRGVRFAVRFGLTVEQKTMEAMIACRGLMKNLAAERIFDELCKLLPLVTAADLKRFAPVLTAVIPELAPMVGFDQHSPHHAYDVFTHTAYVTENVPGILALRWAALLHDTGKVPTFTQDENGRGHFYSHASFSAEIANTVLRRLKSPTALRHQVVTLISHHMTRLEPEKKLLRRRLSQFGWDTVEQLLQLQEADMRSKGVDNSHELGQFRQVWSVLEQIRAENACLKLKDLAVSGRDLMELGFAPGPAIGKCLEKLLALVLDEQIPNEKEALLDAAKSILNQTQEETP